MSYLEKLHEKRESLVAKAEALVTTAEQENRDLTTTEDTEVADALTEIRELDESIKVQEELAQRSQQASAIREKAGVSPTVVKSEMRTYGQENRDNNSFLADAYNAQFNGDFGARERLERHMNEERIERREVTSSNFSGLIVPQYLTDLAAPFARAGRPVADIARKHALPAQGLTMTISKVTTGTAVALQTEGDAVQETDMDDTKLDISIQTIAGQQNVTRQAIERGTGIDALVMADLVSAWNTKLDSLVVAELLASAGQTVTYTDASPTVAELYPKLLDAVQKVQTTFFGGPNVIVMHPRRLAWILASLDSSNRPLAVPTQNGPFNALAEGNGSVVYGNSGYTIAGLPVITDANVSVAQGSGTNQDTIYVGNTQELHLWEDAGAQPMMLRFEQPRVAELDVTIVVYGYAAYTANRYPNAWAQINGTGLVTPTF
jgi:HK97 family phage major capsid protein